MIEPIGEIRTPFPEKFGIPRQSGVVPELEGQIILDKKYRVMEAFRGIEDYEYLWLLWQFDIPEKEDFTPTVRPPRLGGNTRMGVFATRSPFRPNAIGLSCVKMQRLEETDEGPILHVSGVDLRDHTKILDIKPYLPYADAHPDARTGFAGQVVYAQQEVVADQAVLEGIPKDDAAVIIQLLEQDPRPHYQQDETRIYGMDYDKYDVKFKAEDGKIRLLSIKER